MVIGLNILPDLRQITLGYSNTARGEVMLELPRLLYESPTDLGAKFIHNEDS
jgi:hypothetical protein